MRRGDRHAQTLDLVRRHGFMTIEALAERFAVTPQTIRRDINELSEKALLRRYHGGAGLPSSVENVSYANRRVLHMEEKRRIAEMVVEHVPDQASLFINIGTTTEAVAVALQARKNLRVITNNLNVASSLSGRQDFQIIIAGGVVRHRDRGIIGEASLDFIQQFRVDYAIIGISGIDLDGSLLDFDYREVRAAQAIVTNSRRVFLVADHSKFGRSAMVRLGSITEVTALFTDRPPPPEIQELLDTHGVDLFEAGEAPPGAAPGS